MRFLLLFLSTLLLSLVTSQSHPHDDDETHQNTASTAAASVIIPANDPEAIPIPDAELFKLTALHDMTSVSDELQSNRRLNLRSLPLPPPSRRGLSPPSSPVNLHTRADKLYGVYVCSGPQFTNSCVWQTYKHDVCMQLPNSKTLAVGPDVGVQCMVFEGKNCDGRSSSGILVFPGVTDFQGGYDYLTKVPGSYKCRKCGKGNEDCGKSGGTKEAWNDLD